ncbi:MobQ family relaxase, partial [Anaeromassilibacillus sp. An250]|uniref:MobQ family relaxase n=1 Tax=Anaeromassilibacillus sp. An250 TaxID=1965604 RepID=UPI001FA8F5E5
MFKSMKRIIRWAGKYKARLYLGSVCSFFSSLSTAIPTMAAAFALDKAIQAYWTNTAIDTVLIWQTLWIIIGSIVLNFLLSYLRAVLQESIGYEVAAGQRIHLGDVLKRVPLGYFSQNSVGDILAGVTTELSTLELQGMKMVDVIINGYAKFIAIVLCLIFFSPVAAVISIVGVALSALALQGISRHSEKTAATTHKAMEDMSGATIEYIRGLSIVKSFGQEGASIENFRNASKDLKDIHIKVEKGFTPFNCLHLFALKLASMGIVFICAWQALQGQMSMAFFLMFVLFSFVMFGSVENINDAAHTLGVVDSAMNKLEALENVNYIDQDGTDIKPATYDIEFRDVSFGYDSRIVLHDLNFKIPQNSTTAIVGPSGSGKSTLCNLIARFYDVNSGTITIGGTDIRRFTCDSLLKNISMVFQNVYLFRDTIKNNIKFGSPDATDEQIVAAAKAARCHDFIMALPDGYDTVIGEGGSSLSGGEKQRISIARAMLKDAPIVILDEATASIDPENEHLIQEAISALTHGKTIITIAHRLATIENADQILVIDGGTVAQRGTHIIKRSEGRSAVAAAAYRSGTKLTNEWDGLTHDYTRKGGVVHAEIMLPAHAPPEFADRSTLWNSVEQIEKARDSQLAREIEAALPRELSREQQLALVRAYVKDNFVDKGMCADFAIHDKGTGNPHVHIMLTVRPLKENGAWGAKCRKAYDLDENGQRIPDERGGWKNHREDTTDWNDKGNVEIWRAAWAAYTNRALEAAGQPALVDHRSYKRQGIDKIPSVHLGPAASQMEKRGIRTD